jgi:hypothetical protein
MDILILELQRQPLFKERLDQDCKKGEVFPAIRKEGVVFYYRGGALFKFEKRREGCVFSTNLKYASVLRSKKDGSATKSDRKRGYSDYVTEEDIKDLEPITNFYGKEEYKRIKENCGNYFSKKERAGVAKLCREFSCVRATARTDISVLDIEIAFEIDKDIDKEFKDIDKESIAGETRRTKGGPRIDFVLMNKKGVLRFFEAKLYYNPELSYTSRLGYCPLLKQLDRYDEYIKKHKSIIIEAYKKDVKNINKIFKTSLPEPKEIDPKVRALVFGIGKEEPKIEEEKILNGQHSERDRSFLRDRFCNIGSINTKKGDVLEKLRF